MNTARVRCSCYWVALMPQDVCSRNCKLSRMSSFHSLLSISLLTGIPIKTTMDNSTTVQYAGLIHQLVMKARSTIRDVDPQNDLTFLRIRSKKNEIMIAPGERIRPVAVRCLSPTVGQDYHDGECSSWRVWVLWLKCTGFDHH